MKKLEKGENVYVINTDFEKASEKVDHLTLVTKMKTRFGFDGKIGKGFKNSLKTKAANNN